MTLRSTGPSSTLVKTAPVRRDRHDLAVLDQLDVARLAQEGGRRRSQEHLAVADADQQWALDASADQLLRVVFVHDHESEVALELAIGGTNRLREVAVVVALDQVDDRFGVRLGAERVPVLLQRSLELAEVLDDPVQGDRDLAPVAAGERVGVLLGDTTMRRPARVPEADRRCGAVRLGGRLQLREVPDGAHVIELPVFEER